MNKDVPVWERFALTIREAAKYFHIGEKTMRRIVAENRDADFVVMLGNRAMIKRVKFEEFLNNAKRVEDAFGDPEIMPEEIPEPPVIKAKKPTLRGGIR